MGKNPLISVARKLVAMALALIALCVVGTGCADNLNPTGVSPIGLVDRGASCYQENGVLYASGESCGEISGHVRCVSGACQSVEIHTSFGTRRGALELDTSINPAMDCSGNCGPINVTWCGDVTVGGEDYAGRWLCMALVDKDGNCTMKAVQWVCDGLDEVCELSGSYPSYGLCVVPPECTKDADCDDSDQCTQDSCDDAQQCVNELIIGMSCDDGDKCTTSDACDGAGKCAGKINTCDDSNQCTQDSCDAATGNCVNVAVENGTACNDGKACTEGDKCQNGACVATNKVCDDSNECTTDACDPANGQCKFTNVANTTACDDGDKCTDTDECTDGKCAGKALDCDDQNLCTADSCDAATGNCLHEPIGDGGECGDGMICVAGGCYDEALTCTTADATKCAAEDGKLGYYKCVMADGATIGLWELQQECGPVGQSFCINGQGCKTL